MPTRSKENETDWEMGGKPISFLPLKQPEDSSHTAYYFDQL